MEDYRKEIISLLDSINNQNALRYLLIIVKDLSDELSDENNVSC